MNKAIVALGACAMASLAMVGLRSANRMRRVVFRFEFPIERCSTGLFV